MILLRATAPTPPTLAFADRLAEISGGPVTLLLDERRGAHDVGGRARLGLTAQGCRDLGLYCPSDFAWRCGDYGLYLARAAFPHVAWFWLFEDDVRILGRDPAAFFRYFEAVEADLLAAEYGPADAGWYWSQFVRREGGQARRCLFPVVRVSAKLLDVLRAQRVGHSGQLRRRRLWPNDESFVATAAHLSGATCADLNDFGHTVYDAQSLSFFYPHQGETLPEEPREAILYHPVLFGEAHGRKVERLSTMARPQPFAERFARRALGRLNARLPW